MSDDGPLYARFAAQVLRSGSALALQCGPQHIGYRALDSLVEANRRALLNQGHGPGHLIGWLGDNSIAMLSALLACTRLGAVFVPLDGRRAVPDLVEGAQAAGLHAVLATAEFAAPAAALRAQVRWRETPDDQLTPGGVLLAPGPFGGATTCIGPVALLDRCDTAIGAQQITEHDRVLAVLPMSCADGLALQLLPALLVGATVCLQSHFEAGAWLDAVAQWQPTLGALDAEGLAAVTTHPQWADTPLSSLRRIVGAARELPAAAARAFAARGVPVQSLEA